MTWGLVFEQLLNGLQYGVMLFLMAAGLTLGLGIMNFVNLAHGSFYMVRAYLAVAPPRPDPLLQRAGRHHLGPGRALCLAAVVALGSHRSLHRLALSHVPRGNY